MKKLPVILLFIFHFSFFIHIEAQNLTYQQKLFYTCKVWGFVKYFHSNVSTCGVNWDSVLIADLPLVKNAVTKNDFNNALDTMLNAAGPMTIALSPPCDTVAPELSRNLNFGWLNDTSIFRSDVITILDTINNNFRPHAECWVEVNPDPPSEYNGGYLKFGADTLILNINDYANYADEWQRLLELFAFWNISNYFNPNNYIQNQAWDSTLYQNVLNIDSAPNDVAFYTAFLKITSNMDDAHVAGQTFDNYCDAPVSGFYSPYIVLEYIPGKYIVIKSGIPSITKGDEIIAVNGLTTKQWEDSLGPYLSEGDSAVFHGAIMGIMTLEAYGDPVTITYYDSLNNMQTLSTYCTSYLPYRSYYSNDTLANVQWRYWSNCNIGYINVGKMQDTGSEIANVYSVLQNTNAIIFDIRNYPASDAVFDMANNYLYPYNTFGTPVVKYMAPNVTYPGTYYWVSQSAYPGSTTPYPGKVIVLFNEQTVSEAEYASMILGELPNSVKIGSQTDGADGDITNYYLSKDMATGFTALGWFYPNGDSTQRVGIIPDSLVYPTQAGIRAGRDEVLEKAIQVAGGCPLSVPSINKPLSNITVYPNPSDGIFNVTCHTTAIAGSLQIIEIYNVLGEKVFTETLLSAQGDNTLKIGNQPNGVYLYRVIAQSGELIGEGKLVIQK